MIIELFQDTASLPCYEDEDSEEDDSYDSVPGVQERAKMIAHQVVMIQMIVME